MGTLRNGLLISAQPADVVEWMLQQTRGASLDTYELKRAAYHLSREKVQWSDHDQRYVMEWRVHGPVLPPGQSKPTGWFVRVEIGESKESYNSPTEVVITHNVTGGVAQYCQKLFAAIQEQWLGTKMRYLEPPEEEPGAGWTRPELIPGTAGHFRATMERLYIRYRFDGWTSSNGDKLELGSNAHEDDKRGSWKVTLQLEDEPPCISGIEAYERPGGDTLVEFKDGYEPGSHLRASPIGPAFVEFSDMVISEAREFYLPPREAATQGTVADQLDLNDLRIDARLRYQKVIDYWTAHPEKTERQVADHCRTSSRTVQRAMKYCPN